MPWKERSVMDERIRFVIRLQDVESMTELCREFGISRKTGYKIQEACGMEGLNDRSRRPVRYANQLPEPVEAAIVRAKKEKPHWGARKIRERLLRQLPHAVKVPAISTIHTVLDRHDLVIHPRRNRTRAQGTPLSEGAAPNQLWCRLQRRVSVTGQTLLLPAHRDRSLLALPAAVRSPRLAAGKHSVHGL